MHISGTKESTWSMSQTAISCAAVCELSEYQTSAAFSAALPSFKLSRAVTDRYAFPAVHEATFAVAATHAGFDGTALGATAGPGPSGSLRREVKLPPGPSSQTRGWDC